MDISLMDAGELWRMRSILSATQVVTKIFDQFLIHFDQILIHFDQFLDHFYLVDPKREGLLVIGGGGGGGGSSTQTVTSRSNDTAEICI